jgi:hypothetical protein
VVYEVVAEAVYEKSSSTDLMKAGGSKGWGAEACKGTMKGCGVKLGYAGLSASLYGLRDRLNRHHIFLALCHLSRSCKPLTSLKLMRDYSPVAAGTRC